MLRIIKVRFFLPRSLQGLFIKDKRTGLMEYINNGTIERRKKTTTTEAMNLYTKQP